MLNETEREFIYEFAYVPEHLPDYVMSVSGEEPFLHESHLCFFHRGHLTFVGYPLGGDAQATPTAYESTCSRFQPHTVAILAAEIWLTDFVQARQAQDWYYRLELPVRDVPSDVAYMVRRARREVDVTVGRFAKEHKKLVKGFMSGHELSRQQRQIFKRIPDYLKRSSSAFVLEARRGKDLVAYDVIDIGSADYGFYLFNFRSSRINVPGVSDLLVQEMATMAHSAGKRRLNLGLGVHPGVRRFKEKWGAIPFLPYSWALVRRSTVDLDRLARKL